MVQLRFEGGMRGTEIDTTVARLRYASGVDAGQFRIRCRSLEETEML